ncbi:TPA: hypothetical protein QDB28_002069 [Burkholderia vietnamiensis]|uniref:hypothetical protein n=1 Tax=Burkholderia vietnamiensis TaxID=60552 RepID=UPI00158BBC56|nr:hypothetical protein [Burkholderia vietnamiensis]HDR9161704.1 hypothetical protein [Burkholderia vietnamiensis]
MRVLPLALMPLLPRVRPLQSALGLPTLVLPLDSARVCSLELLVLSLVLVG